MKFYNLKKSILLSMYLTLIVVSSINSKLKENTEKKEKLNDPPVTRRVSLKLLKIK